MAAEGFAERQHSQRQEQFQRILRVGLVRRQLAGRPRFPPGNGRSFHRREKHQGRRPGIASCHIQFDTFVNANCCSN